MTQDSTSVDDVTGQTAALSQPDETLGSFLKKHRQSQGKDLEEIAKIIRIHASTLRAIEEDNPKALPAEVFARGFIKNYAQYLGLDPNQALAWYIEQNDKEARPTEKINVQEVLAGEALAEVQTFPVGRFIIFFIVIAVLFLIGYSILSFLNSSGPPVDVPKKAMTPPAVVGQQQQLAAPVAAEPGAAASAAGNVGTGQSSSVIQGGASAPALSAAPDAGSEKSGSVEKMPTSLPEKAGQVVEPKKAAGEQDLGLKKKTDDGKPIIYPRATKEKPAQSPEPQEVAKPVSVPSASGVISAPAVAKASGMNYVLDAKFTATTWVSVQIDKEKKKSAVYQPGDHMVWQAEKKISLFVGNAGGIALALNGKAVPPIGKSMESVRIAFPVE